MKPARIDVIINRADNSNTKQATAQIDEVVAYLKKLKSPPIRIRIAAAAETVKRGIKK